MTMSRGLQHQGAEAWFAARPHRLSRSSQTISDVLDNLRAEHAPRCPLGTERRGEEDPRLALRRHPAPPRPRLFAPWRAPGLAETCTAPVGQQVATVFAARAADPVGIGQTSSGSGQASMRTSDRCRARPGAIVPLPVPRGAALQPERIARGIDIVMPDGSALVAAHAPDAQTDVNVALPGALRSMSRSLKMAARSQPRRVAPIRASESRSMCARRGCAPTLASCAPVSA